MSAPASTTDETPAKSAQPAKAAKQPGAGATLITVVLGTWIGVACAGGVVYMLVKSGKIAVASASAEKPEGKATRSITLEPILANLADPGGHAYVRVGLRVDIAGDPTGSSSGEPSAVPAEAAGKEKGAATPAGSGGSELESSIRDTVLGVLGRQTSTSLLGPDGKEHLKIELREAIERGAVRVDVKDVFFTDFLVQI